MRSIPAFLFLILSFLLVQSLSAQAVYRTPSGARYHLGNCHNVRNVSHRIKSAEEIIRLKLTPCLQCKPPALDKLVFQGGDDNDGAGMLSTAVQCEGKTIERRRCLRRTKIANGYCFQHQDQIPDN